MLSATKHLDLERAPLRVASEILISLRARGVMSYDDVMRNVDRRVGDMGDSVVMPAINLLFLFGLIEYHLKNDTFEYLKPKVVDDAD